MNRIKGATTWKAICKLSVGMTNGGRNVEFDPTLAYIASNSMGGRSVSLISDPETLRWPRKEESDAAQDKLPNAWDDGLWLGFAERDVMEIQWTSASSGARIRAFRASLNEGDWLIEYDGPPANEGRESSYLGAFMGAMKDTAIEAHLELPDRIRNFFREEAERVVESEFSRTQPPRQPAKRIIVRRARPDLPPTCEQVGITNPSSQPEDRS